MLLRFIYFIFLEFLLELNTSLILNKIIYNNLIDGREILKNWLFVIVYKTVTYIILYFIFNLFFSTGRKKVFILFLRHLFLLFLSHYIITIFIFKHDLFHTTFIDDPTYGILERLFIFSVVISLCYYIYALSLSASSKRKPLKSGENW